MAETIGDRVDRLIRETLDTHVDLLAQLMAEAGLENEIQLTRLDRLIRSLRERRFESTIFEAGRRMPTSVQLGVDPPRIVLNEELLSRVSDDEVLAALARPIAQILEIAPMSVSMSLQIRDEKVIKGLSTKASRRNDAPMVRANDLPAFITYKMEVFGTRLSMLAAALGTHRTFEISTAEETQSALRGRPGWPEWADVMNLRCAADAIAGLREALVDTPWEEHSEKLAELTWDSLALSGQTFLRHAGRELRGENVPKIVDVLTAFLRAIKAQERTLTEDLASWSVFSEIHEAWLSLDDEERRTFCGNSAKFDRRPVSVVDEAGIAFGIREPASLPWEMPLVCWTSREQTGLRDLFVGIARTLPGRPSAHFFPLSSLTRDESPLGTGESNAWSLSVDGVGVDSGRNDADDLARAYSASLATLVSQFLALPANHQTEAVRRLRRVYDEYFPQSTEIWARRFAGETGGDFHALLTGIQHMVSSPVMFDPFLRPSQGELAPFPTLTVVAARQGEARMVPFWVPVSLLASTIKGPPIRIRLVRVTEGGCTWDCDKTLSLGKLEGQSVDLILRAIHGDALQFVLTKEN